MGPTKLRAGTDVQIETVLTEKQSIKRVKVPIETDEMMPVNKGQVIFEFHGSVAPATNTQCKNVVNNFVKMLNK